MKNSHDEDGAPGCMNAVDICRHFGTRATLKTGGRRHPLKLRVTSRMRHVPETQKHMTTL